MTMMKSGVKIGVQFTAQRMVREYKEKYYQKVNLQ
jgi:hypothetical protein